MLLTFFIANTAVSLNQHFYGSYPPPPLAWPVIGLRKLVLTLQFLPVADRLVKMR